MPPIGFLFSADRDLHFALLGKLHGIAYQINQHLTKAPGVTAIAPFAFGGHIGV